MDISSISMSCKEEPAPSPKISPQNITACADVLQKMKENNFTSTMQATVSDMRELLRFIGLKENEISATELAATGLDKDLVTICRESILMSVEGLAENPHILGSERCAKMRRLLNP